MWVGDFGGSRRQTRDTFPIFEKDRRGGFCANRNKSTRAHYTTTCQWSHEPNSSRRKCRLCQARPQPRHCGVSQLIHVRWSTNWRACRCDGEACRPVEHEWSWISSTRLANSPNSRLWMPNNYSTSCDSSANKCLPFINRILIIIVIQ